MVIVPAAVLGHQPPDLGRIHGLNESILVKSLYEGREFTYRLVKAYADQR